MKCSPAILFALLFCLPRLAAQEEPVPVREVELRFYAYGSADFSDLILRGERGAPQLFSLYAGAKSPAFEYRGPPELTLYREVRGPDGLPQYLSQGSVEVPAGIQEALVLVLATPPAAVAAGQSPLRLFLADDSEGAVPANHLAFLNLTGAALEGVVGDAPVALSAGLSEPIPVDRFFGHRGVLVGLTVRYEGSARVVMETRTRFHEGRRVLIVLLPPSQADSLEITAFRIQDLVTP